MPANKNKFLNIKNHSAVEKTYIMMSKADCTHLGSSSYICLQDIGDKVWYIPSAEGESSGELCFQWKNKKYHAIRVSPQITIKYSSQKVENKDKYGHVTSTTYKLTILSAELNIALSNNLIIQFSLDGGANYNEVGTISAGAYKVDINYTLSRNSSPNFATRCMLDRQTRQRTVHINWTDRVSTAVGLVPLIEIDASAKLQDGKGGLASGKIRYVLEWHGVGIPWEYEVFDETLINAGGTSGSYAPLPTAGDLPTSKGWSVVGQIIYENDQGEEEEIGERTFWIAWAEGVYPFSDDFDFYEITGGYTQACVLNRHNSEYLFNNNLTVTAPIYKECW